MIFFKNLFKGVGLATLSLINFNKARGLLGRSCLKSFNIIKDYPFPYPYPYLKKINKIPKIYFFVCDDIFLNKTHTLSDDRESLVTSLLVFLTLNVNS